MSTAEPGNEHVDPSAQEHTPADGRGTAVAPRSGSKVWLAAMALGAVAAIFVVNQLVPLSQLQAQFGLTPAAEAHREPLPKAAKSAGYRPTSEQWQTLSVETVDEMPFRTLLLTDGKIAIDEDHTTPVFSPYTGRVLKLFAKPGDHIQQGSPLFLVEASDMVQGQNDFIAARAALNKAKSQLQVAEIILKRHRELVAANAISKRELEQSEIGEVAAVNDLKSGEVAYEAARNRLRILGKTDAEINAFEEGSARISAETVVMAPLSGTVVQRKVGPGQYVTGASNDPVFLIGDLSTVWLVANVRETDATKVKLGQEIEFTILAQADKTYTSRIDYISSSVNSDTRRLQVRAAIKNPDGVLRPEMFANVSIAVSDEQRSPGVSRSAMIYEGDTAYVWVVRADRSIERRRIARGTTWAGFQQVVSGLATGDKIIGHGSIFIDRLAAPVTEAD